ncbi:glutathione peroxidase [Bermanella sp. R86510]|uniref:glutathione peroxidase n=1 Tax=unclassified Bermanella TaxID=2627862 RepID=UPI0037CACFEE
MLRGTFTLIALTAITLASSYKAQAQTCPEWLNVTIDKLHSSKSVELCEQVAGRPVLIVNTASHCGFTKQFSGLETLHNDYKDKGLVVIGFPSDSFNQEADNEAETASVCFKNFGVTFLMSKPVTVLGNNAHGIFKHLTQAQGAPSWNFNKYLVAPNGVVIKRYDSRVSPQSPTLINDINQQFSL